MYQRLIIFNSVLLASLFFMTGCTTTSSSDTARTGMEQLLISNAVDQSLDHIDYSAFNGQNVFLDDKYLESIDKPYIVSSLRHRILHAGATIVAKPEEADSVLEIRSGGVGTDRVDAFIGIPKLSVPGMPIALPEVRLWSRIKQSGTAKIGLVSYDAKSNQILGNGGMTLAKSSDNNTFLLGIGPWQNGSVRKEVKDSSKYNSSSSPLPRQVAFSRPSQSFAPGSRSTEKYRLASEEKDADIKTQTSKSRFANGIFE